MPTGGAIAGPSGASVGGAAMGHRVDGGQNGRMSATELHNGSMRPLTQRHTQLAFAFAIWNPINQMAMKQNIFILTHLPALARSDGGEVQPRIGEADRVRVFI